ncbi:MAG TPA: sugar phosphate isomerase/epimerase family protein [Limnochordia bacterium]
MAAPIDVESSERSGGRWPITVFTKPWKCPLPVLAEKMRSLGVAGVELPVRPGYPVHPDNAREALPAAARLFAEFGLKIVSVAGPDDEATIAACGDAGVPLIRVCKGIDLSVGYRASVDRIRAHFERLLPALGRHGVRIGLQNHAGLSIGSAVGLMDAIGSFDPQYIGAVLDVAHCGLDGEPEEMAIDIVWSHLCLVNLKNAFRRRVNGPEADEAVWRVHWTTGRHGFVSWRKTLEVLKKRGYAGALCLTAEYSRPEGGDLVEEAVEPLIAADIAYVRSLTEG